MIRHRFGRFTTVFTAAAMALTLLGVGTASAAPPRWVLNVVKLPATVSPAADAGYRVTITNNGPSNISALYLVSDKTAQPSHVGVPSQGTCNATGPLFCAFGALGDDESAVVTVAYETPGSGDSFQVIFQGNTTGNTFSDIKGRSHGDTLFSEPKVTTTALSSNADFAGGFSIGDTSFQNVQDVRRQNPQATTIENFQSLIPVTIQDGITTGVSCTIPECSGGIVQWSSLGVAENFDYEALDTPFKVSLLLWGGAVSGNPDTEDFYVLHKPDVGPAYVIDVPCSPSSGTPTNAECLTVTEVGINYRIDVWLYQNGFVRGGI